MNPHGIMFHHFHNGKEHIPSQGSIASAEFEKIILFYKKNFKILSADTWYQKAIKGQLDQNDVCLTFDDALRCQFDLAWPVLEKHSIKAFWFVNTGHLENKGTKLEIYRYFRFKQFPNIDAFYAAFDSQVSRSQFSDLIKNGLRNFEPSDYLPTMTFYSNNDKKFRYIRDVILTRNQYDLIMGQMMANSGINIEKMVKALWMDEECIKTLHAEQHIIGLHSHTHPTNMGKLSRHEQEVEYRTNFTALKKIIQDDILTMSHPCNSYNSDTLDILNELNIRIGFRADMAMQNHTRLEFPRLDHTFLIKEVRK